MCTICRIMSDISNIVSQSRELLMASAINPQIGAGGGRGHICGARHLNCPATGLILGAGQGKLAQTIG